MPPDFTTESSFASHVFAREQLPPTMKPSPACAPREGAPSLRRRRNDSLPLSLRRAFPASPCVSLHALRHHRLRRCAARPAALTGWALLAGCRDPLWLPYGGLLKLATSAVRASAQSVFSLGPQFAHKSTSLPSALIFSSAARGRAPFGAERFFVRGARRK